MSCNCPFSGFCFHLLGVACQHFVPLAVLRKCRSDLRSWKGRALVWACSVPCPAPQGGGHQHRNLRGLAEGSGFQHVVLVSLRGNIWHFSVGTAELGGVNKKLEISVACIWKWLQNTRFVHVQEQVWQTRVAQGLATPAAGRAPVVFVVTRRSLWWTFTFSWVFTKKHLSYPKPKLYQMLSNHK